LEEKGKDKEKEQKDSARPQREDER
jgi:hypothetical protein